MIISRILIILKIVFARYDRPKWMDLIRKWKSDEGLSARTHQGWGQPVIGRFRHWTECPSIPKPVGSAIVKCDSATCAVDCNPGFQPDRGTARAQCRELMGEVTWTNVSTDAY